MPGKITLVTPPDIFENQNPGILFVNISADEQDAVSKWLSEYNLEKDINFYIYTGEADPAWFFWALNYCQYKYVSVDNNDEITQNLIGYVLTKNNVYYSTQDQNLAALFSYINNNRVEKINSFLERAFSE